MPATRQVGCLGELRRRAVLGAEPWPRMPAFVLPVAPILPLPALTAWPLRHPAPVGSHPARLLGISRGGKPGIARLNNAAPFTSFASRNVCSRPGNQPAWVVQAHSMAVAHRRRSSRRSGLRHGCRADAAVLGPSIRMLRAMTLGITEWTAHLLRAEAQKPPGRSSNHPGHCPAGL